MCLQTEVTSHVAMAFMHVLLRLISGNGLRILRSDTYAASYLMRSACLLVPLGHSGTYCLSLVPRPSAIISVGGKDGLVYTVAIVQLFPPKVGI